MGCTFPLIEWADGGPASVKELTTALRAHRNRYLQQATEHGAVLFTNTPLQSFTDFDGALQALDLKNFPYRKSLSNAVRVNLTERVFTANEAPPDTEIFFHHEMAQTPIFPGIILFYCEKAPERGGATPLCRSDWLFDRLQDSCPAFIKACEEKGLKYTSVMPSESDTTSSMGRSWKNTLNTKTRDQAETRLSELRYTWCWRGNGDLEVTSPPLPAVAEIAPGRKVFFNQLIAAFAGWKDDRNDPSKAIRHGDGSRLDIAAVKEAISIANELTFDIAWKRGEFALIDNTVVMHARRTFTGERRVLASLACMREQAFTL